MADDGKLSQFITITGANDETARFFLAASRNDVDAAVNAFFEADGMIPSGASYPTPSGGARPAASRPAAPASTAASSAAGRGRGAGPSRRTGAQNFATLGSLRGDADDENESGKNYYAGGEKSGQMIQDPRDQDGAGSGDGAGAGGGAGGGRRELAEAILNRARQRQAEVGDDAAERARFENQRFTGAGFRLGDTAAPAGGETAPIPTVVGRRNVQRQIAFYDNGFVVDDGPLRSYEDPANAAFLADVNKGVVPHEMEEPGVGDVSITLLDKKGEAYEPPKRKIVPFSGGGQRLGAETSATSSTIPANVEAAASTVTVDESRPVAIIQIRLSDGTRLRARLNDDNTVGDLRRFVAAARPVTGDFILATTFPRAELNDDNITLKDAGLKGAVVVQTMK